MPDFDPQKDQVRAYLAGALTAYALGLKAEDVMSGGRGGSPAEARARSTVSYACQVTEDLRDDPDFDIWVEQLSVGLSSVAVLGEAPAEEIRIAHAG